MRLEDLIWRLRNLDDHGQSDEWWQQLYLSQKKQLKELAGKVADLMVLNGLVAGCLDTEEFVKRFKSVFQYKSNIHPYMQQELIVLLFREEEAVPQII